MVPTQEKALVLRPGEHTIATIREDAAAHAPWIALFFIWIVGPFFFLFPLLRQGIPGMILFVVLSGLGFLAAARHAYRWRRTRCMITDQRLIDIEQRGFFDAIRSEVSHAEIAEVTCRVKGVAATTLRYGTLRIQTFGPGTDIELRRVRQPARFQDLIQELREQTVMRSVGSSKTPKRPPASEAEQVVQTETAEVLESHTD
ncbi:PH domain-containing protein [Candidatus Uhrbacteria bacterium]|nr:PH domain-containing protein [Candidatus Uhrbacteria bacterium]